MATSTPLGDQGRDGGDQANAFGDLRVPARMVSSTKSMTGHLLGAAGVSWKRSSRCWRCTPATVSRRRRSTSTHRRIPKAAISTTCRTRRASSTVEAALSNSFRIRRHQRLADLPPLLIATPEGPASRRPVRAPLLIESRALPADCDLLRLRSAGAGALARAAAVRCSSTAALQRACARRAGTCLLMAEPSAIPACCDRAGPRCSDAKASMFGDRRLHRQRSIAHGWRRESQRRDPEQAAGPSVGGWFAVPLLRDSRRRKSSPS